jgi:uncharacterized protein (DUF983 family)
MSTDDGGMEFVLDRENTFGALPGTMTAVSCPSCFNQQLLKDVIDTGTCRSCGADLELTLSVQAE